jgi:valyl-tRNA synthetase
MKVLPELEKRFDPASFEMKWYRAQEEAGLFRPEAAGPGAEPFVIVIPPPNVTGRLHVGHALGRTLEDVLCRWRRMQGRAVLWVPGVDHAGIATQMVVERDLKERTGKSRHDLGREAFVALCREWADARRKDIIGQIRRLGSSCDFTREYYTLDELRSNAVRRVFTTLYHQGLAYRAERMVNWCPSCATVLSELEVNHVEQSGLLWSIAYPLEGGDPGELVVATTRPETMLGDTALAVNPQDERARALAGRKVRLPLTSRVIPIIADSFVDPQFGTGVVKVTPAHDPNDFEAGKRHGLDSVVVIGFDGKMTQAAGEGYAGLDRFDARKKVLRELEVLGLRRGEKSHVAPIGRCQRCDSIVEPLASLQWFVKIAPLAEKAVAATDHGETRFTPELWKKTYDEWMRNIRDWCISRQLWWGHEIPAWYCADGHITVPKPDEADPAACGTCGKSVTRDPDVFDTWFSSWLMPFSVMGWPAPTHDLARYYPTTVLVTAFDILFFWVARMIMAGCWFTGKAPFADVFLHGLVRLEGQKMSKTKGNVIDPLVMCDEFGADAVRFSLAIASGTGRDPSVSGARFESSRKFATKVWNAARFALGMLGEGGTAAVVDFGRLGTVDRWILARLAETAGKVNASLEVFRFDEAASALYEFFWSEFCDGYLEMVKPVLRDESQPESVKAATRAVLRRVLLDSLALLHPFMPFVSSELREMLNGDGVKLAVTPFPSPNADWKDPLAVETVETLRAAATRIRNLRAERGLAPAAPLTASLEVAPGPLAESLKEHASLLRHLARLESLEISEKTDTEGILERVKTEGLFRDAIRSVGLVVALPVRKLTDEDRTKLLREIAQVEGELEKVRGRLADASFAERAPSAVVEKTRKQLAQLEERGARLRGNLEGSAG